MTTKRYRSRWAPEVEVEQGVAMRGLMVARVVVPRSEMGNFTAHGVEEVAGWAPSAAPRNPIRLGNFDWRAQMEKLAGRTWRDALRDGLVLPFGHRSNVSRLLDASAPHPALLDPREVEVLYLARPNGFINLGLHFILDRIFNINTPDTAIDSMGISNDTTAVVATTLLIDPTAGAGSPDFQALGSGVGAAATSRTGNTVTASSGWEPADFSTVFPITKVGLSTNPADSGDDTVPTVQGVVNIIGGVGGSAPYNEPFTIDLTTVSDFDLTLQQQITAQAT